MQRPLYVLKVGGAVATRKSEGKPLVRRSVVKRVAKEIAAARQRKGFSLVLVHGAGPFGHVPVKRFGLERKVRTRKQKRGVVETHASMEKLNRVYLDELRGAGLDAFPVQTSATVRQRAGKVVAFDEKVVKGLLELGAVPVLYGDVVVDETRGASVISGDVIAPWLARKLHAKKVLFGTDVKGIYDGKPGTRGARLVEMVMRKNYPRLLKRVGKAKGTDVTGGMRGKLEKINALCKGLDVSVFSLKEKGNLLKALSGERVGTVIRL